MRLYQGQTCVCPLMLYQIILGRVGFITALVWTTKTFLDSLVMVCGARNQIIAGQWDKVVL